jgi:hypothetical protein
MALYLSRNAEQIDVRVGDNVFEVDRVDHLADRIDEDGPLLFQDLKGTSGQRSIVLDHEGGNDFDGWKVYYASPADRPITCVVEQIKATDRFIDCDGREIVVTDLRVAVDVDAKIEDEILVIDLGAAASTTVS